MGSHTCCLINTQTEAASGCKGLCLHFQEAQTSEFSAEPCSGLADGLCPPRRSGLLRCPPHPVPLS